MHIFFCKYLNNTIVDKPYYYRYVIQFHSQLHSSIVQIAQLQATIITVIGELLFTKLQNLHSFHTATNMVK